MPKLGTLNSHSLGNHNKAFQQLSNIVVDPSGLAMEVRPATVNRDATAAAWERKVQVALKDGAGELQLWCNSSFATTVSIADTSVAGTATINSTTLTFVDGIAEITVSGDAAAWLAAETDTVTVGSITINGQTVTGGTSVQTFV